MGRELPVIFSYCATFLPKEMLHVFRQVSGIASFENHVVTRKRTNADRFPFPHVHVLKKPPFRFLARLYHRARNEPVPVSRAEIGQMLRLVESNRGQLAHVYLGTEACRVLEFLKRVPAARIVSFHGADLASAQNETLYQNLWPLTDLILCRSESLKQELIAKGCPEPKIRLNYTGVPVPAAPPARVPPGPGRPMELLQVCRFIDKKGLDVAIDATARLIGLGLNVRLTLAGDGPLRPALERQAQTLGIATAVTFAGFLPSDRLQRQFASADIFVHPSRETGGGDREGIPNSLLEAMAAGLPSIATRHSGIPEAIEDGVSGLLIADSNPSLLADTIKRLAESPELWRSLSEGGWRRVKDRFSVERCVSNLEELYREAIRSARTR